MIGQKGFVVWISKLKPEDFPQKYERDTVAAFL